MTHADRRHRAAGIGFEGGAGCGGLCGRTQDEGNNQQPETHQKLRRTRKSIANAVAVLGEDVAEPVTWSYSSTTIWSRVGGAQRAGKRQIARGEIRLPRISRAVGVSGRTRAELGVIRRYRAAAFAPPRGRPAQRSGRRAARAAAWSSCSSDWVAPAGQGAQLGFDRSVVGPNSRAMMSAVGSGGSESSARETRRGVPLTASVTR